MISSACIVALRTKYYCVRTKHRRHRVNFESMDLVFSFSLINGVGKTWWNRPTHSLHRLRRCIRTSRASFSVITRSSPGGRSAGGRLGSSSRESYTTRTTPNTQTYSSIGIRSGTVPGCGRSMSERTCFAQLENLLRTFGGSVRADLGLLLSGMSPPQR